MNKSCYRRKRLPLKVKVEVERVLTSNYGFDVISPCHSNYLGHNLLYGAVQVGNLKFA